MRQRKGAAAYDPATETPLDRDEIRLRATRGAALYVLRGIGLRIISLASTVALARLLVPETFGIIALGMVLIGFGVVLSDGGFGALLIARANPPSYRELDALLGFQLAVATFVAIAIVVLLILLAPPEVLAPTAVMMLALPLSAAKGVPLLISERALVFRPRILTELAEATTYAVVAVTLAILGADAWAIVAAVIAKAVVGLSVANLTSAAGIRRPIWSFACVRPLLPFGVRFSLRAVQDALGDTVLMLLVASAGGLTLLGLLNFTLRLLATAQLAVESLAMVSFPAVSRLLNQSHDMLPPLQRAMVALSTISGAVLAPVVASSPASIPIIFGDNWSDAAYILPGYGLMIVIGAPIGVAVLGYLQASGDTTTPLRANLLTHVVRTGAFVVLVRPLEALALGVAAAVAPIAGVPMMLRAAERRAGGSLTKHLVGPVLAFALSAPAGYLITLRLGDTVPSALAGAFVAIGTYVASSWTINRTGLAMLRAGLEAAGRDAVRRVIRGIRAVPRCSAL